MHICRHAYMHICIQAYMHILVPLSCGPSVLTSYGVSYIGIASIWDECNTAIGSLFQLINPSC